MSGLRLVGVYCLAMLIAAATQYILNTQVIGWFSVGIHGLSLMSDCRGARRRCGTQGISRAFLGATVQERFLRFEDFDMDNHKGPLSQQQLKRGF